MYLRISLWSSVEEVYNSLILFLHSPGSISPESLEPKNSNCVNVSINKFGIPLYGSVISLTADKDTLYV